jgi:glycosyltransferase involved in cell wall biosynthesis
MRVLYVITKSKLGGAQVHVSELVEYFQNKGHSVGVVSSPGGWLESTVRIMSATFFSNPYFSNSILNPLKALKSARRLRGIIANYKPDLISCHSSVASVLTRVVIGKRIPIIYTIHSWAFAPGAPLLRRIISLLAEKLMAKYVSKFICVSRYNQKLALKSGIAREGKTAVVYNGVAVDYRDVLRDRYREKKVKIIFVGRLARPKNPELLIEAYSLLSEELLAKSSVLIVGGGSKLDDIKKLVAKHRLESNIGVLGEILPEKLKEIYGGAHIFVLPSDWEGFPITTLEAMGAGLVPIVTDVGGAREAFDEQSGYVIRRGDANGLKNILEDLIKDREKLARMANNAFVRVRSNFSLEKMLKETESIYQEVLEK